ncbi:hypothetical protein [Novosphingopyxis sp.]|uniref:hypothetical protein n=1 Tax=Novosphingopyxis sp. TaxID=2709690 RepID=UPI003B5BF023
MQLYDFDDPIPDLSFENAVKAIHGEFEQDWRQRRSAIARLMRAFRKNDQALRALIRQHVGGGQWPIMRGTQSFYLYESKQFRMRANLWFPASHPLAGQAGYRDFLTIEKCHNHDFSFFSICVLGSGYTTRMYGAKDYAQTLQVGERVILEPECTFGLNGDTVMYVERDLDFHSQLFPETLSVTVNLIPAREMRRSVQYSVDEENGTIERKIHTDAGASLPDRPWSLPNETNSATAFVDS